jgi:hypothetical protein
VVEIMVEREMTNKRKKLGRKAGFFANFEPNFLDAQAMKSTP